MNKNRNKGEKKYWGRIISWLKHKDNYPYVGIVILGIIISSIKYGFLASFVGIIGFIVVFGLIMAIILSRF